MSKLLIGLFVLLTSSALIILKLGTNAGPPVHYAENGIQFNLNFYTVSGIFLYGMSFLVYMYLISKYDLGYIIPITTALVYVLIFTASYFIFHEVFTVLKIIGISFIVIGLIFLNLNK